MNSGHKSKSIDYLNMPKSINWAKMKEIYDFQPKDYEQLLSIKGVGPNTVRALALISDLIYGEKPSWSDPVKYSFTVGGKDGVPFPVDRKAMDESTEIIKQGIKQAKVGDMEKETYKIVGSLEANPLEKRISNESTIEKGIIGSKKGRVLTIKTEAGRQVKVKIIDVK